ncbi:MAG: hypothetical protein H7256_01615 [Bdellovibrio sp.]|nr:hypothetical protein [Bdellovibrio sp.]
MSKILNLALSCIFLYSCKSTNIKTELPQDAGFDSITKTLSSKYPDHNILTLSMLANGVENYFKKEYPNDKPGLICGFIRNKIEKGCVVALAKKLGTIYNTDFIVFVSDNGSTEVLEDFSKDKEKRDHIFITRVKESDIIQDKNAPDFEQLKSGIKRVAYQQSVVIYYWENLRAKKLWIED